MEQLITNIWNLNALIGGILLLIILVMFCLLMIASILFLPFMKNDNDYE